MARPARLRVNLLAPDGSRAAARGLAPWLVRTAPASARGNLTVALVSDPRMRSLNRMFRGKDYSTDVLAFPTGGRLGGVRGGAAELGDIVIAMGVAGKQAREHGHAVGTELRILALHGLLHLLGYDHDTDAGRMARAEARLRKKGGLPAGLIGRAEKAAGSRMPVSTRARATAGTPGARHRS